MVQLSEPLMDSPNPTPILQILENALNPVDSKHLTGEITDDITGDKRQLGYIFDSKHPPPINIMFGPLIEVSNAKDESSSSSKSDSNFDDTAFKPPFTKPIQVIPLKIFTPQNNQTCSAKTNVGQNILYVQTEDEHVIQNQPEPEPESEPSSGP